VQRGEFHLLFVHHKKRGLPAKTARNLKYTMTGLSTLLRIKPDFRMIFKTRTRNRTGFYFLKEQDLELGFQFYFDVELEKKL
jgi:hypothetical protein